MAQIPAPDGQCDSFLVHPGDGKPHPKIVLLMDAFGLRPYLEEMAVRLAGLGYVVVVPNLFYRLRPAPVFSFRFPLAPEQMAEARKEFMPAIQAYDFEAGVRDIGAILDFLDHQPFAARGKAGLTGYCMGGGMALRAAGAYPDRVAVAASFHGGNLATDAATSPSRYAQKAKAKIYVAHADHDSSMPPEQQKRLEKELKEAGVRFEAELYRGALHGFTMKDLPAYNAEALERHWQKVTEIFRELGNNS